MMTNLYAPILDGMVYDTKATKRGIHINTLRLHISKQVNKQISIIITRQLSHYNCIGIY